MRRPVGCADRAAVGHVRRVPQRAEPDGEGRGERVGHLRCEDGGRRAESRQGGGRYRVRIAGAETDDRDGAGAGYGVAGPVVVPETVVAGPVSVVTGADVVAGGAAVPVVSVVGVGAAGVAGAMRELRYTAVS